MSIHHSSREMDGFAVVYWWGGSSFWLLSYLTQIQWLQQSALILMGCFKLIFIVHFGCGNNMMCGNKNPTYIHCKVWKILGIGRSHCFQLFPTLWITFLVLFYFALEHAHYIYTGCTFDFILRNQTFSHAVAHLLLMTQSKEVNAHTSLKGDQTMTEHSKWMGLASRTMGARKALPSITRRDKVPWCPTKIMDESVVFLYLDSLGCIIMLIPHPTGKDKVFHHLLALLFRLTFTVLISIISRPDRQLFSVKK